MRGKYIGHLLHLEGKYALLAPDDVMPEQMIKAKFEDPKTGLHLGWHRCSQREFAIVAGHTPLEAITVGMTVSADEKLTCEQRLNTLRDWVRAAALATAAQNIDVKDNALRHAVSTLDAVVGRQESLGEDGDVYCAEIAKACASICRRAVGGV